MGDKTSLDSIAEQIVSILEDDEVKEAIDKHDRVREEEDRFRNASLKEHNKHDMLSLFRTVNPQEALSTELEHYLNSLTYANQLGRYPVPFGNPPAEVWAHATNVQLRSQMNDLIYNRYDELMSKR